MQVVSLKTLKNQDAMANPDRIFNVIGDVRGAEGAEAGIAG